MSGDVMSVGPSATCPRCGRVIVLDDQGRMPGHWDFNSYDTAECPGTDEYNTQPTERTGDHEAGVPWWAVRMELRLLEKLDELLGQRAAAERLEIATRRAWEAVEQLGSSPQS